MKTFKLFYLFFVLCSFIYMTASSQDKPKFVGEKQSILSTDVPTNGPQISTTQSPNASEINRLTAQLNIARSNGDATLANQLQTQISFLSGDEVLTAPNHNGPALFCKTINQPLTQTDNIYISQLPSTANWSVATSTELVSGRNWIVTAPYNSAGSDTLKFFSSVNNGRTWTLVNQIFFGAAGAHFTWNCLQAEALYDGTTGWIFAVGSLTYGGVTYSFVTRFKYDGSVFFFSYLNSASATVKEYWPRMTSDNWRYPTIPYIIIINTQDSMIATNNHTLTGRLSIVTTPYATTPTITYNNHLGIAGFGWWQPGAADSVSLYNDIAWYDSAGGANKLIVVSNFYNLAGAPNIYIAQNDNYGSTAPQTETTISEPNAFLYPSIAFTGEGPGNGMIVYRRFYSGGDWDAAYQRTTNFGVSWTMGFIDYTSDTTYFVDAKAIKGANGDTKIAWTNIHNGLGVAKYEDFTNTGRGDTIAMNPTTISASTSFGIERAGYTLTGDNCLSTWCTPSGTYAFVTAGCSGTVTGLIGQNNAPYTYKLNQNYPNPFNPTTRINYSIKTEGMVSLKIYDITGREVATLVNEVKTPGIYSLDFNAGNLSSGVYFYKLVSGSFNDVKKLILVK